MKQNKGMTLLELVIAMAIIGIMGITMTHFIFTSNNLLVTNQNRAFAIQKSIAMMGELRAYAEANESSGGASTLDAFDDGVNTLPMLTTDATIIDPADILSGNEWDGSRWRYSRRITVRKFASLQESNVRIVSVKIFLTAPGANDASSMAEITSVITTQGENTPTTQVYDIYLLTIENIPGWWVYMAYLKPFVENALGDMESRNPGMSFRTHWISKAAYGRDQEYKPYFNNSVDSNQDINWAYFYPGSMPNGSAVNQYYIPGDVKARINIDGAITPTTVNDYNVSSNPYPYTLADQYNHAMRSPDEWNLYNARSNNGANGEELTYRLLLDDMVLNPQNYRNAIIMNLHGELLPMPSLRNYSDAAKDPATYPGWRAVTHPENISYTATTDMNLRVYAYTDTVVSANPFMPGNVPISIVISSAGCEADFTQVNDLIITAIEGGTDQQAPPGPDTYVTTTGLSTQSGDRMYYNILPYDTATSSTIINLYNTPLMTPNLVTQGLGQTRRLYGKDYIPCPVESTNVFTQNLTSTINAWDAMANAPSTVLDGGALAYNSSNNYIYAIRGTGFASFWRYNPSTNLWNNPTDPTDPATNFGAGAALAYDGANNNIYAFKGASVSFWRYTVGTGLWTTLDPTDPTWVVGGNVGAGGALVCTSTPIYIYALRGNTSRDFSRYNIATNNWITSTNITDTVGAGGALVSTGGNFIYALRGNNSQNFYRYDISLDSWSPMAPTIGAVGTGGVGGGSLVYPGFGDYIYAFQGCGNTAFWRYAINGTGEQAANTWIVRTPTTSYNIGSGGALVYANSYIYGFQGNSSLPFLRCCSAPKNTARWVITISASAADREFSKPGPSTPGLKKIMTIRTRIGDDLTTGEMWPTKITPTNLSTTYIYRNYTDAEVPFSERYQFQGDPRHSPYADIMQNHRYNWYFDNLRDATYNVITEWPSISATLINNGVSATADGWHGSGGTNGDRLEIDVPRLFSFFKTALTGANCVYTTITGFSYYYMGLGNEIGYDGANGFANSIPVSAKPFTGATATSRNEQSITTAQTGGVKYIREKMTQYWWGMPWLGELYPDKDNGGTGANVYVNQWAVNGNLNTPTGTAEGQNGKFVRIRREDIQVGAGTPRAKDNSLISGTTFYNLACVRRTEQYGCTSLFNIGLSNSTFRHNWPGVTQGNIATAGQEIANAYNFPLPAVAEINRAFRLDYNWGVVPTEFNHAVYSDARCSSAVIARFYGHNDGVLWEGSSLVRLQSPTTNTPNAFIVVSGLAQTAEIGSAFISRYAILNLLHSYLTCGILNIGGTPTPSRIAQLPRIEIKTPNVMTELDNPTAISITWSIEWKRWDGQPYTTDAYYAGAYAEPGGDSNLQYALLYTRDNGVTWLHIADNSPATAGKPNQLISDINAGANEIYWWDVSNMGYFMEGSYIVMIEAYRNNQPCHYSYHQQKIYLNR